MSDKRERYDSFAVPRNFGEDGVSFNGISRRNLVEGCILAVASGYPIIFGLTAAVSTKVILLCFVSLPLFFIGLVGFGGESLSQFLVTVTRFLLRRRRLRYYIDTREPEPERAKGFQRVKSLFRKRDKDAIVYKKVKKPKKTGKQGGLFDRLFLSKSRQQQQAQQTAGQPEVRTKSRKIKNMAQDFLPVEDIRGGMVVTRDKRYIKIIEIQPINFLLRSADEQRDIIMSFAELLRIAPVQNPVQKQRQPRQHHKVSPKHNRGNGAGNQSGLH